jgi:hypothetical protein
MEAAIAKRLRGVVHEGLWREDATGEPSAGDKDRTVPAICQIKLMSPQKSETGK